MSKTLSMSVARRFARELHGTMSKLPARKAWRTAIQNLGRCPKCMRQSFLVALAAWAAAIIARVMDGSGALSIGIALGAGALSLLWVAHLLAYAARSVAPLPAGDSSGAETLSRRDIIPKFARAVGVMALVTATPASVWAQSCCDCSKCASGQNCCNTAHGCCGCFPGGVSCPS